ncbi:MAG: 2-hydroxyethylphosphonate methyltransferase [Alphaproteobacteria bacterium MarineAlpha6_Bin6]|nr:MAG: 2-hydroxyethylphosphonate methyltransferase [Alphaproteobacteria bacterium MarineAlpha6_Bin6]PPR33441.1 MAG: 2-hydroxyethylphosphonate methyltransferase [Alphaproteobacteria bacterium MarineAlpha6_Bin5]
MDVETPRPDGSLGPLYLASALEKVGIETEILDASVGGKDYSLNDTFYRRIRQGNGLIRIGMNFNEIADYVEKGNFDFVAISSNFTPQTSMAFKTAEAIKERNNEIKIFAGGVNARNLYHRFLKTGNFDGICLSEGEIIFPKMILASINNYSVSKIPGTITIDKKGLISINPVDKSCFPNQLDDLEMPKWEALPFEKYEKIASPHGVNVNDRGAERYAPIMTSRGCPFKCAYCHISQEKDNASMFGNIGNLRTHSIDRVIKEIDHLVSLKVKKLFFEDDSLLAHKDRVKTIFKKTKNKKLSIANVNGVNLVHFFNSRDRSGWVDGKFDIDVEYLEILRDSGFDQIVFPVESAAKRILKLYATNKVNLDRMNLPLLMKKMTDLGIQAPVNMMIGFPDETEEEINMSIDFAKILMDNGAPYVTFFVPIPFPGSNLYNIAINGDYLDKNFDTDKMNWKNPVMKNTTVSPEKLIEIRDKANEIINTKEHLKKRLINSAGHRFAEQIN